MNGNLPEWIQAWQRDCPPESGNPVNDLLEAISIAWEALNKIAECDAAVCPESQGKYEAKDALRRIEELGR